MNLRTNYTSFLECFSPRVKDSWVLSFEQLTSRYILSHMGEMTKILVDVLVGTATGAIGGLFYRYGVSCRAVLCLGELCKVLRCLERLGCLAASVWCWCSVCARCLSQPDQPARRTPRRIHGSQGSQGAQPERVPGHTAPARLSCPALTASAPPTQANHFTVTRGRAAATASPPSSSARCTGFSTAPPSLSVYSKSSPESWRPA